MISFAASLLCSAGTTYLACCSELRLLPAALMRPKAPKAGKRILLEHIPLLWNRFSFLYKVSIRNIVRYKKRLFMMLLGIGGCTALIVAGFGVRDSIATVAEEQFNQITHYDISVTFSAPMDKNQQANFRKEFGADLTHCIFVAAETYEYRGKQGISNLNLVATDDPDIGSVIGLHLDGTDIPYPSEGAVVDAQLIETMDTPEILSINVSDTKSVSLPVQGSFENYVYHYAYLTAATYEAVFGEPCEYNTAYLCTDGDAYALGARLANSPDVASVTIVDALRENVSNMMKSLNYVVALVILSACALALVVLFNLCNISITERVREIATLKVLGFYPLETQSYVFREILILTVIGTLLGLPFGWALHRFIMECIRIDIVSFHVHVTPLSYLLSFGITVLLGVLVCILLRHKIERVHMAESLKSVE